MNNNQNELTQLDLLKQINDNLQRLIKSNENTQYLIINTAYHFLTNQNEDEWEVVEDLHACVHNGDQRDYLRNRDC